MITARKKGRKTKSLGVFVCLFVLNMPGLFLLRTKIGRGGSQT